MLSQNHYAQALRVMPPLQHADPKLANEFKQKAYHAHIQAGHDVFLEGDEVDTIALLISGVVRVYKIGETGREITLYRFGLGESCILTANAILSRQSFPAIATVEQDAAAIIIEADTFREWVRRYDAWRDFVFDLLSQRLSHVMLLVDEVAFRRMDARIAAFLLEHSQHQNPIHITHQEIAAELGSSREVISRILIEFAAAGWIETGRGAIRVLDQSGLTSLAAV